MALRFRRTKKLMPGLRANIGKKNASLRIGLKGLGLTIGTAGKRVSAGLPGTGLHATSKLSSDRKGQSRESGSGSWVVTLIGVIVVGLIVVAIL